MNVSQLAEPDARRGGAQHRGRHHAALTAVMVCRISQDRTRIGPSVQQHPPRFSNITETEAWHDFRCRAEERKVLCTKPLRALRIPRRVVLRSGFHVPWGTCASPSPSHEEGVALLVARTCNEVVPTHKEFLRATDPRTSDLYSLLGACMYRTRYQICRTWNERLETGVRTACTRIVYYYCCCCT